MFVCINVYTIENHQHHKMKNNLWINSAPRYISHSYRPQFSDYAIIFLNKLFMHKYYKNILCCFILKFDCGLTLIPQIVWMSQMSEIIHLFISFWNEYNHRNRLIVISAWWWCCFFMSVIVRRRIQSYAQCLPSFFNGILECWEDFDFQWLSWCWGFFKNTHQRHS